LNVFSCVLIVETMLPYFRNKVNNILYFIYIGNIDTFHTCTPIPIFHTYTHIVTFHANVNIARFHTKHIIAIIW